MPDAQCPPWEYRDHPDCERRLPDRCRSLLVWLFKNQGLTLQCACDSRPYHRRLFAGLTPKGFDYYAGNYRGSQWPCLRFAEVGVGADPRVGLLADRVHEAMVGLTSRVTSELSVLDVAHQLPNSQCDPGLKLLGTVVVACGILEEFLRVHPYLNGNGHAGRFIVWAILWRYSYWPRRWPLDQSPPYGQLLSEYRNGNPRPLEQFLQNCL